MFNRRRMMSEKRKKILIVDDELGIRDLLMEILTDEGYAVVAAENAKQAWAARLEEQLSLILLDIWMPETDGVTLLKQWVDAGMTETPVIIMSGHATIDTAVEAMKLGAQEVLEKPIAMNRLLGAVQKTLANRRGEEINPIIQRANFGKSQAMRRLKGGLMEVSENKQPVLLVGSPNDGMSFFAQFLRPPKSPMVFIDDGAQLEENVDGILRRADGGLVIVRMINFLNSTQQSGLLGLAREAGRLGIRVAAGCTEEPAALFQKLNFSEALAALFLRQVIMLPSLADAQSDIPDLVALISKQLSADTEMAGRQLSVQAVNVLCRHHFENDFAELMSIVRSALMCGEGDKVEADAVLAIIDQFERHSSAGVSANIFSIPLRDAREAFEREYFYRLMEIARGDLQQAAKMAGLERTYFYRKMRQYKDSEDEHNYFAR